LFIVRVYDITQRPEFAPDRIVGGEEFRWRVSRIEQGLSETQPISSKLFDETHANNNNMAMLFFTCTVLNNRQLHHNITKIAPVNHDLASRSNDHNNAKRNRL
jgi:hypothetical protein